MAATPPKAGTTCAKFGQIKVYSGKKFTCIKSNSKLVWSKGVIVTKFQANSTVSPSTTPLPSVTPVSKPNPSPSPSATNSLSEPSFIQSEELASAEACKLTDRRINKSLNFDHYERNNGFPLQGATLPTSGKARFLTILVDFSDAPGTQEDLLRLRAQEKYFTQWFKEVSNGKLEVEIRSVDTWFRAPKPSSNYELTGANYGKHPDFAQEFVNLTGNSFNWFDVNTFMIHFPDSQKTRFQSAQLGRNVLIRTPQGNQVLNYQYYGVWQHETARMFAKKYPNYWAGQWIHESLHDLGLTLHAPGNGLNTGVGQSQASYSLMLDAWEQFKLGWITDKEVFCAPKSKLTSSIIYLNPLEEIPSGYRVLVIPTSDQEALVVESRRPKGLSSAWPESMRGIFVYRINTSVVTDRSQEFNGSGLDNGNNPKYAKWAFYLNSDQKQIDSTLPSSKLDPEKFYQEWIIREGETVSADGVKISFLTSSLKDIIQISRI
jgi:M6 family metalloprotease-like protein